MAHHRAITAPFAGPAASESVPGHRGMVIAAANRPLSEQVAFANDARPVAKGGTDVKAGPWTRC